MLISKVPRIAVPALALLAGLLSPPGARGAEDVVYLNSALRALRGGDSAEALQILDSQSRVGNEGVAAARHHGLACRAWLAEGQPAKAREHCALAITLDSSRSRWRYYNNLGVAAYRLGDDAAASEAFKSAAILSGVVATPRQNLAIVEQQMATPGEREQRGQALVIR